MNNSSNPRCNYDNDYNNNNNDIIISKVIINQSINQSNVYLVTRNSYGPFVLVHAKSYTRDKMYREGKCGRQNNVRWRNK